LPIIATAAWSIPKVVADRFATEGSGITRYASVFNGVEVNSTFYRRHKPATFTRWAESVPDDFRFSIKMPREITHMRAMSDICMPFSDLIDDVSALGDKLGPLLCQLPPSLVFNACVMERAFEVMRAQYSGPIVIEVRHKSWAETEALSLLDHYSIDRVLADPVRVWPVESFAHPARYIRLHGKPRVYYSSYTHEEIKAFSRLMGHDSWCVFDNTASGAAIENALDMLTFQQDH